MVGWGNLKSDGLNLIDWDVNWHGVLVELILSLGLDEAARSWGISVWNGSVVHLSLNEALSLWLGVLLVVLLALLVMMVLLVLVSLKNEMVSIRWQLN